MTEKKHERKLPEHARNGYIQLDSDSEKTSTNRGCGMLWVERTRPESLCAGQNLNIIMKEFP